jgi:hypothetical protein
VLGDRIGHWHIEVAAMDHADADVRLPDLVVAHLAGNGHCFTKIDDHIDYLMVRIDPGKVTPARTRPHALRTSNGGAVSATLSMEAALWTYNLTNAIVNGGRASSSARAAIKAWIEVDGEEATFSSNCSSERKAPRHLRSSRVRCPR